MSVRSSSPSSSCAPFEDGLSTANLLAADISTYAVRSRAVWQGTSETTSRFFSTNRAVSNSSRDCLDEASSVGRGDEDLSTSINSSSLSNYRTLQIQRILGEETGTERTRSSSVDSRGCPQSTHESDAGSSMHLMEVNSESSRRSSAKGAREYPIPRDLMEPFYELVGQLRRAEENQLVVRYRPLARYQVVSVLRCMKGNVLRSYQLCLRYSALLDRLGLETAMWRDVEPVLSRQCMYHLPSVVGKDGSATYIIRLARFPPPPSGTDFEGYASSLLRALLFHIEAYRKKRAQASQIARGYASSNSDGDEVEALSSLRRTGGKESYTFIVDAHKVPMSYIETFVPLLPFGKNKVHHSYPLRVSKVLVWYDEDSERNTPSITGTKKKFPSQWWLTMCLTAYKFRYLPSPISSRTHLVKVLDPFFSQSMFKELLLYIDHAE